MSDGKRVEEFFDTSAPTYAVEYRGPSAKAHGLRARAQVVLDLFDQPGGRVLDVGCGPAIMTRLLAERGCEVTNLDFALNMLVEGRRQCADIAPLHFVAGSAAELPFRACSFDAVLAMGLIEYLPSLGPGAQEMARVLRPRGSLIVSLINRASPYGFVRWELISRAARPIRRTLGREQARHHIAHATYTLRNCARALRQHGCTVEAVRYYNFEIPLLGLERLVPTAAMSVRRLLESLRRTPFDFLGGGFVVKARRCELF